MYRPHPFSWVPADGARHASAEKRPAGGWPDDVLRCVLDGLRRL
ncbi:hypothetical protein [Saccharopolyspora hattusasensis]